MQKYHKYAQIYTNGLAITRLGKTVLSVRWHVHVAPPHGMSDTNPIAEDTNDAIAKFLQGHNRAANCRNPSIWNVCHTLEQRQDRL